MKGINSLILASTKLKSIYKTLSIMAVVIYMALIFYLSSIPLEFPEIVNKLDPTKFSLHIVEYSILGLLLFNLTKNFKNSFLIGTLYGISDEIHQYFVPFRTMNIFDVIADVIGVLIGIKLYVFLEKKIRISSHSS
jgi:VanZ family protein